MVDPGCILMMTESRRVLFPVPMGLRMPSALGAVPPSQERRAVSRSVDSDMRVGLSLRHRKRTSMPVERSFHSGGFWWILPILLGVHPAQVCARHLAATFPEASTVQMHGWGWRWCAWFPQRNCPGVGLAKVSWMVRSSFLKASGLSSLARRKSVPAPTRRIPSWGPLAADSQTCWQPCPPGNF